MGLRDKWIKKSILPDVLFIHRGSLNYTAILWKTPLGIIDGIKSRDCPLRQLTEEEKVEFGIIEGRD